MKEPISEFMNKSLKELVEPSRSIIAEGEAERHRIYASSLAAITRHYWSGNKYGLSGTHPQNPMVSDWGSNCPHLGSEYRGHNIAAIAVDHDGYVIDFDFNHNTLFDSSVEHAEARLIRRLFSLTQLQDSWNVASEDNPADKYSNALSKVTIYTSLESCTQCTGIMMLGRVKQVVYLQSDPGMYRIGDFLHTLTARKENQDFIRAPEPISADRIGLEIVSELDSAFRDFVENRNEAPPFFIDDQGKENRTSSITSFLCTEAALKPFSKAADLLSSLNPVHPDYRPVCEEDDDNSVCDKLTNAKALVEAQKFVDYATRKGSRGTPHR